MSGISTRFITKALDSALAKSDKNMAVFSKISSKTNCALAAIS